MSSTEKSDAMRVFRNDREATFLRRPNRFIVIAEDAGEEIVCHLPNPGRLMEILLPGVRLILEGRASQEKSTRKTDWTAVAAIHRGRIVPLVSARMNQVAETIILPKLFPQARNISREFTVGKSRFDFLVEDADGGRNLVEVKACSLVEFGTAMFPDAPSARAVRHLEELATLSAHAGPGQGGAGYRSRVLFVIGHGEAERFVPNLHTDPLFATTIQEVAKNVSVQATQIVVDASGLARMIRMDVPVNLSHGTLAKEDRGAYFVVFHLAEGVQREIGGLGQLFFHEGWYVYCGSARRGLSHRIARHARKSRKKLHWHLDYLIPAAAAIETFPVATEKDIECELAAALIEVGGQGIPRFGSSDCGCPSHLFYFPSAPLQDRRFVDTILRFRHVKAL